MKGIFPLGAMVAPAAMHAQPWVTGEEDMYMCGYCGMHLDHMDKLVEHRHVAHPMPKDSAGGLRISDVVQQP